MRHPIVLHPREQGAAQTAEARLLPMLLIAAWGAALAGVAAQALAPSAVERYALAPLLIGIVLIGLPHGALDHLVPARIGLAWGRRVAPLAAFLAAYLALAGAVLAAWLLAPTWAFVGFLAATIWHWGQGDQRFLELFLGRRRRPAFGTLVTIATRGALPVVVPILAFPAAATDLQVRAASGLGLEAAALDLAAPWLRLSLGSALALLLTGYLAEALAAAGSRTGLLVDLGEIVLLVALFAFVPAYAAIGIYFLAWHSLRHLARLLLLKERDAGEVRRGRLAAPVARLARDLLPLTVVALGVLLALTAWSRANLASLNDFVAVYLVLISALTVPHAAVVAMMDLRPGTMPGPVRARNGRRGRPTRSAGGASLASTLGSTRGVTRVPER
jgi:beta-carotene 15,15'-dioxygenase